MVGRREGDGCCQCARNKSHDDVVARYVMYLLCSSVDVGYSSDDVCSRADLIPCIMQCCVRCTDERSCAWLWLCLHQKDIQGTVLHFCIGT